MKIYTVKSHMNYGAVKASDINGFGTAEIVEIDDELDGLAVSEAAKALRLDRRLVNEEIGLAVVGSDESKALLLVEPLYHPLHPRSVTLSVTLYGSTIGFENTCLSQKPHRRLEQLSLKSKLTLSFSLFRTPSLSRVCVVWCASSGLLTSGIN